MYARWIETIQKFPYVFKHKSGTLNRVVDALNRKVAFITTLQTHRETFD